MVYQPHRDSHSGSIGTCPAIIGFVGEDINPGEARGWGVGKRPVCIERHCPVCWTIHHLGCERIPVRITIIRQDTRSRNGKSAPFLKLTEAYEINISAAVARLAGPVSKPELIEI